jgi:hypothetical protein
VTDDWSDETEPNSVTSQGQTPFAIVITAIQSARLLAICEASGSSPDKQIGAMIDLEFEEWQDALDAADMPTLPRSSRWLRFAASEGGAS